MGDFTAKLSKFEENFESYSYSGGLYNLPHSNNLGYWHMVNKQKESKSTEIPDIPTSSLIDYTLSIGLTR